MHLYKKRKHSRDGKPPSGEFGEFLNSTVAKQKYICYLLHSCIATDQLLPQVGNVMVKPFHVLLKVLPEGQKRLFHFTLELLKTKAKQKTKKYFFSALFSSKINIKTIPKKVTYPYKIRISKHTSLFVHTSCKTMNHFHFSSYIHVALWRLDQNFAF